MPSTHTPLGVELMVTGENAGTWGTKTNTNLQLIEQISAGYISQACNTTGATTLAVTDGGTGAALATRVIILTGALAGNITVTIPLDVENWYFIKNATTNAYTVEFKYVSGSGSSFTWTAAQKDWRVLYAAADDGTNPNISEIGLTTSPAGSTTQIQYNDSGAFGGDADLIWTAGTGLTINSQKELRLADTDDDKYIGMKSHTAVGTSYTLTWPQNAAGANDYVLTSQTDGTLAWVENTGGTSWQAVVTGATQTAVAGNGYFIDTTSNACNLTLPGGTLGDEVSVVDYAGTFDTNNLTVTPDSGEKIQGNTADATLTVATERAGFTLAYSGATQGWLLKNNQEFNGNL